MAMGILDVKRVSQSANHSDSGLQYTEVYQVPFAGDFDIVYASATNTDARLPKKWSTFAGDTRCYASNVRADISEGSPWQGTNATPAFYDYIVQYNQKSITFDPNPLNRPPDIKWGGSDITFVPTTDKDGKRITNSAHELYEGIPPYFIRGAECTITRNELANPAFNCTIYSNALNSANWYGVAAENGYMGKITSEKVIEALPDGTNLTYWRTTYPIRFRRDSWRFKPIDAGYVYLDSNGKQVSLIAPDNTVTRQPALLDGSGNALAAGSTPVLYPASGYAIAEEIDWSPLNLPNPFA